VVQEIILQEFDLDKVINIVFTFYETIAGLR
jgi:hypothetical protein